MDSSENDPIDITSVDVSGYADKQLEIALNAINKSYAITLYGNNICILKLDENPIKYLTTDTFRSLLANRLILEKGKKPIEIAARWLQWRKRREYDDVVFYPGDTSDRNVYNLWRGYAFEPLQGDCSLFLDHMRVNICAEDDINYNWLLDWMADAIQRPHRKNWTAVLLESAEEGTGKGFFATHFGKLFGNHYAAFNKPKQLLGQFNSHLEDKLMLFLDEGAITDREAYSYAKSMISEPTINIEPKGRSMREVSSYHRIIMASNEQHTLKASVHDRRWMVLRVSANCKNNLEYFRAIETQLKNGGYQALMHLLANRKYNEDTIKLTIKTKALTEQIDQNLPHYIQWWRAVLTSGMIDEQEWPFQIATKNFYNSYIAWCERMKINKRETEDWLPRRLNDSVGTNLKSINKGIARCYDLPDLHEGRKMLAAKLGYAVEWGE